MHMLLPPPQVCRHLSCPRQLRAYSWQHLANSVWALGSLGHAELTALEAVEREVTDRLLLPPPAAADRLLVQPAGRRGGEERQPSGVNAGGADAGDGGGGGLAAATGGAAAVTGGVAAGLAAGLDPVQVAALKPQHVGNMLWGYGSLEVAAPGLCGALLRVLAARLPDFSEQVRGQEIRGACIVPHYWDLFRYARATTSGKERARACVMGKHKGK